MLKLRVLILLGLCFAVPAQAGLFSDDDARKQIQQVEARVLKLEEQVEVRLLKLEEQAKQQTKSIFDLQGQIDVLNGELRKLRGQNEELAHGLQEAEKREKDFYVDLDARLRHFEAIEAEAAKLVDVVVPTVVDGTVAVDPDDPAAENRAIEAAYGLSKAGQYADSAKTLQAFLKKYPGSVHASNARYWLGSAQFALKDYKEALVTYRSLLKDEPNTAKAPDVLFAIAGCQYELKAIVRATATLKQLIADYPDSAAAAKAKKLIADSQ